MLRAFGAFAEASESVHTLCDFAATAGAAAAWRRMGSRTQAEARAFLVTQLRRSWGISAARAAAHLRTSRVCYVGMPARVAQGLRRAAQPRPPVHPAVFMAGLRPDLVRPRH